MFQRLHHIDFTHRQGYPDERRRAVAGSGRAGARLRLRRTGMRWRQLTHSGPNFAPHHRRSHHLLHFARVLASPSRRFLGIHYARLYCGYHFLIIVFYLGCGEAPYRLSTMAGIVEQFTAFGTDIGTAPVSPVGWTPFSPAESLTPPKSVWSASCASSSPSS